jgi:hypothetical protein
LRSSARASCSALVAAATRVSAAAMSGVTILRVVVTVGAVRVCWATPRPGCAPGTAGTAGLTGGSTASSSASGDAGAAVSGVSGVTGAAGAGSGGGAALASSGEATPRAGSIAGVPSSSSCPVSGLRTRAT